MTGLIEKINWKKNRDNIRFFIIIFFFVGGYIFFFSSQMWMPVTADASYITPVPGGVGPMTIAMLMNNIVKATKLQN